ncbi:two pore domain potassium channel family protein [archaeon]|nr:MAG: two pore domain potassium channel family protein [archaeon]
MIQARVLAPRDQSEGEEVKDVRLISIDEYQKQLQKISTNSWALLMFIIYLIIGIFAYSVDGKTSTLDSIYLSVITFTTVGYGKRILIFTLCKADFRFVFEIPICRRCSYYQPRISKLLLYSRSGFRGYLFWPTHIRRHGCAGGDDEKPTCQGSSRNQQIR